MTFKNVRSKRSTLHEMNFEEHLRKNPFIENGIQRGVNSMTNEWSQRRAEIVHDLIKMLQIMYN